MNLSNRGSALAAVLVVTILATGVVVALATYTFPFVRTSGSFNQRICALYAAEAGLERVRYDAASSNYDSTGNLWLMANSDTVANGGFLVYDDLVVGSATTDVRVFDIGAQPNQYYRVESTATYSDRTVTLAWEIRARDTFAKYLFFVDVDNLNVGTTTMRGAVYVGKRLNNYYGGAKYYKSVESRMGVTYNAGATSANTFYYDTTNFSAPQVNIPSTSEIATLHTYAEAPQFDVQNSSSYYSGGGSMNTYVTLTGSQVSIVAKKTSNGQVVNSYTGALPQNGLLFSQGDVYIQGDISGRLTVASMGKVNITGKIRYIDSDGDFAYVLTKDGSVVPNNDDGTTNAWTSANGYDYVANSDFDPDPIAPPTLGLMAAGDIEVANGAPYNMEQHAATFAATGRWSCNLGSKKGNLRVLGSLVQNKGGWRYNGSGYGYAKSGEYIYDSMLLQTPPPFYLNVDQPLWGPRWEISSN